MAKGYVIQVGFYSPIPVIISQPTKDGEPGVDRIETHKQVGKYSLVNRARVWARRVLPDGKPHKVDGSEAPLEVTDPKYKGRLEFLPWGSSVTGAQAIEIRYLTTSTSLDYEYQRAVQKIETRVEDGTDFFDLQNGENKFDYNTQALFIQFLQVHPGNRDSVSKNPDPQIKGYTYHEIKEDTGDQSSTRRKESGLTAGIIVYQLSAKDDGVRNLFSVILSHGVDFGTVNNLSLDKDIYNAMLDYSAAYPEELKKYISEYKETVRDLFEKGKSYDKLDLTKNGYIAWTDPKQILWEGLSGKGKEMIEEVVEECFTKNNFEKIKVLKTLCEQLK